MWEQPESGESLRAAWNSDTPCTSFICVHVRRGRQSDGCVHKRDSGSENRVIASDDEGFESGADRERMWEQPESGESLRAAWNSYISQPSPNDFDSLHVLHSFAFMCAEGERVTVVCISGTAEARIVSVQILNRHHWWSTATAMPHCDWGRS
jgi:hypothetical protein